MIKSDLADKLMTLQANSTLRHGSASSTPRSGSSTSTPRPGSATSTPRNTNNANIANNLDSMNVSKISRVSTSSLNNYPDRLNNSLSPMKTPMSTRESDLKTSTPKEENSGVYNVRLHTDRQRAMEDNSSPAARRRVSETVAPRAVMVRQPMHRSERSQSQSSYPGDRPPPAGQSSTLPRQRTLPAVPRNNDTADNLLRQSSNDDLLRDNNDNNTIRRRSADLLDERSGGMPTRSVSSYQLNSKTQSDKNHNAPSRYVVSQRPLSAYHSSTSSRPYSQEAATTNATTNRLYSDLTDNTDNNHQIIAPPGGKTYQDNLHTSQQPPQPPPRKAKPGCSIGNPALTANRPRSGAFQPIQPADAMTSPEGGATGATTYRTNNDTAPRTLQKTEDRKANGRETPPKPSQDGQTKENSIWYEYGCVWYDRTSCFVCAYHWFWLRERWKKGDIICHLLRYYRLPVIRSDSFCCIS